MVGRLKRDNKAISVIIQRVILILFLLRITLKQEFFLQSPFCVSLHPFVS